jgi:hypothetical protein
MSVTDKIRALRREIRELESAEHPAAVEAKQQEYADALHRERGFVANNHAAALRRGDGHERIPSPLVRGEYVDSELSGFEAAARYERQLQDIDAEIERVTKLG